MNPPAESAELRAAPAVRRAAAAVASYPRYPRNAPPRGGFPGAPCRRMMIVLMARLLTRSAVGEKPALRKERGLLRFRSHDEGADLERRERQGRRRVLRPHDERRALLGAAALDRRSAPRPWEAELREFSRPQFASTTTWPAAPSGR